jgi:hypothetical protein
MVQIAHAMRALAFISFRYIVGLASFRLAIPLCMKPVPMYIGEPGLYLSDTFSLTQSRLAAAVGAVKMRLLQQGPGHPPSSPRPFIIPKGFPNEV